MDLAEVHQVVSAVSPEEMGGRLGLLVPGGGHGDGEAASGHMRGVSFPDLVLFPDIFRDTDEAAPDAMVTAGRVDALSTDLAAEHANPVVLETGSDQILDGCCHIVRVVHETGDLIRRILEKPINRLTGCR